MKTLKEFLEKKRACKDNFDFAKDLTLEQFLNTCPRGDWILWLFAKMNPKSLRELTLAKGHCANTVRGEMKDERSTKAVDVAIAFGEGRATRKKLNAAASAACDAYAYSDSSDSSADSAAYAAYAASNASADSDSVARAAARAAASKIFPLFGSIFARAAAYAADSADSAEKQNQKLTADICRKYLPLEIWNQNLI